MEVNWEKLKADWQEKTKLEWNDVRWKAMSEVLTETDNGKALLYNLAVRANLFDGWEKKRSQPKRAAAFNE